MKKMIFGFAVLAVIFACGINSTQSTDTDLSSNPERMQWVYECKPDYIFGSFWPRWRYIGKIRAAEIPAEHNVCTKTQALGGNICMRVNGVDGQELACTQDLFGAYGSPGAMAYTR